MGAYFNKSNKQELSTIIKQAYLLSWASIQLKVYTACCFIFWLWRRHGWQALDVPAKDDDGGDCDNNAKDEQLCFKQEVFASKIVLQFSSFSENLMQMSTLCHCLCCCRLYCLNNFWNGVPIYIYSLLIDIQYAGYDLVSGGFALGWDERIGRYPTFFGKPSF